LRRSSAAIVRVSGSSEFSSRRLSRCSSTGLRLGELAGEQALELGHGVAHALFVTVLEDL